MRFSGTESISIELSGVLEAAATDALAVGVDDDERNPCAAGHEELGHSEIVAALSPTDAVRKARLERQRGPKRWVTIEAHR